MNHFPELELNKKVQKLKRILNEDDPNLGNKTNQAILYQINTVNLPPEIENILNPNPAIAYHFQGHVYRFDNKYNWGKGYLPGRWVRQYDPKQPYLIKTKIEKMANDKSLNNQNAVFDGNTAEIVPSNNSSKITRPIPVTVRK